GAPGVPGAPSPRAGGRFAPSTGPPRPPGAPRQSPPPPPSPPPQPAVAQIAPRVVLAPPSIAPDAGKLEMRKLSFERPAIEEHDPLLRPPDASGVALRAPARSVDLPGEHFR